MTRTAAFSFIPPPAEVPKPQMNGTEARYAQRLELLRRAGEVISWSFQTHTFLLGFNTRYTPDFEVVTRTGVEYHEVKAGRRRPDPRRPTRKLALWKDDSRAKWKIAASLFPHFRWVAASREGNPPKWHLEDAVRGRMVFAPAMPPVA